MRSQPDRHEGVPGRGARAVAALHRFERAAGLYRPGRSPWVWVGPAINLVGSFVMIMWVGIAYDLGVAATIPTAFVLALFMGAMSAAFLATWEDDAEEDERRAAEEPAPAPEPPHGPELAAGVTPRTPGPRPTPEAVAPVEWRVEAPSRDGEREPAPEPILR